MPGQPQTYANHVHQPRAWSITWLVAALAFLVFAFHALREPDYVSFALLALAGVVLSAVTLVRQFALRLQNRIIRLEMQLRLARLGRERDLTRLALPQLIALRFASDAELPTLIERALAENLSPDQIKRAVTDWQADYLRT
jgi:predicted lysophospholipase L1 biosynthesis ABC-type transport system permease subunit